MQKSNKYFIISIIAVIIALTAFWGISSYLRNEHIGDANKQQVLNNDVNNKNNDSINKYDDKIKEKWEKTLPYNTTNGLVCAAYNIKDDELYLKYNSGICVVDANNEINRYLVNEGQWVIKAALIDSAKEGSDNYRYISLEEFENIIK